MWIGQACIRGGECLNDSVVTMPNSLTNRFTSLTHIPVYHNPYMGIESLYMLGLGYG